MRILGLDHGTKRIGVAVSDELQIIAQPLEFVPAEPVEALMRRLGTLIADREVGSIVVGMPRNMDGSYGPAAESVRKFIADLQAQFAVPVRTWDERLTSAQANRVLIESKVRRDKRKASVDRMAAAILLQSFLDAQAG
jgi:putative Holliday junction resolvase